MSHRNRRRKLDRAEVRGEYQNLECTEFRAGRKVDKTTIALKYQNQ